ncbi:hypothetical protein [Microlunatus speluncae]|uniref:hypothetical protein n=1 Tax=Microlunatus speluncae TaxID=2594267 RepID=UPI0012663C2B|nr:hypothetical protein [Microlunatus speluncae]
MSRRKVVVIGVVVVVVVVAGIAAVVHARQVAAENARQVAAENARQAFYRDFPALERRECLVAVPEVEPLTEGEQVPCHEARDIDLVVLAEGGCPAEAVMANAFPTTPRGREVCLMPLVVYKQLDWDRAR